MRITLGVVFLAICLCLTASAQNRPWTFDVGGGYSPLLGNINNYLQNGWQITAGAGYEFGPAFSASVDYMYNHFSMGDRVLSGTQATGSSAHLWALTVDPKLTLKYVGRVRPYIVGGIGYYRRTTELTQPAFVLPIGNGTFGGLGGSLGAGFDVNLRETGLRLFAETRYHYASTGNAIVRMVPLTAGIRW